MSGSLDTHFLAHGVPKTSCLGLDLSTHDDAGFFPYAPFAPQPGRKYPQPHHTSLTRPRPRCCPTRQRETRGLAPPPGTRAARAI